MDQSVGNTLITQRFDQTVKSRAKEPATQFMGQERSFGDLAQRTEAIAKGLQDLGVKQGDKVGLVMGNSPQFICYYYAVLKIGAVVVNFNPLYTSSELTDLVALVEPKVLVTFNLKEFAQKVDKVAQIKDCIKHVVMIPFQNSLPFAKSILFNVFKRSMVTTSLETDKLVRHADLIANEGGATYPTIGRDDLAVLQFTGGTTGLPKAAMLTHGNIAANLDQCLDYFGTIPEGSSQMVVLPFFHIFAMTTVMNFSVAMGMKMVMMPRFEIKGFLDLIQKEKPNIMCAVPTIFQAVLNNEIAKNCDLSSLQYCISGGAPLPAEVKRSFEDFAECVVVEGYGMSETSPVVASNPLHGLNKPGSIGNLWTGIELSIRDVDDHSKIVDEGASGELCFKGPNVMAGYYGNPESTENAFVDGYFRSGDVGHVDEEGYLFIDDRLKDMIICSGYKVYPKAIEEAIYEHPAVAEALVLSRADTYRGEAPVAYVAVKDCQALTGPELLSFLKSHLSKIEMPDEVVFRDVLPKTLIGKPSRKDLRLELIAEAEAEEALKTAA